MKNKFLLLTTAILTLVGCSYPEKYNENSYGIYDAKPENLFSFSQKELADHLTTPNVNENNLRLTMQYWQETTYVGESNYDFVTRNISNTVWANNYVNILKNLELAKKITEEYVPPGNQVIAWPGIKKNRLAMIDLLSVFTYQNLVNAYGNIPYSQALDLEKYPLPVYDDAATIYASLIARVNTDISNLDTASTAFGTADVFYAGNVTKWKKFANSLLLKLGICLADSNPTLAQSTVNAAIAGGVITSSADNCSLVYLTSTGNKNPIYAELVDSGRADYIGASTMVDFLQTNNDARLSKYFQPAANSGTYVGGVVGAPNPVDNFSLPGTFGFTATTPGVILGNTETAFYLLEAAARWNSANAPAAYSTAVTASFTEWGVASSAAAYISAHPYNAVNWKQSVGEQAWLAMYNQPYVSWDFYRRLDYPALVAPPTANPNANGKVPVRLQYPTTEVTSNGASWAAGSAAIGGDRLYTKVFWDKF